MYYIEFNERKVADLTFVRINKDLMTNSLSNGSQNKIEKIFNESVFDSSNLDEKQLHLYNFLKNSYRTREEMKNHIGVIEGFQDLSKDFLNMAINFRISADHIVTYMAEQRSNGILDFMFFPMVYLYRQSLELLLKAVYFQEVIEEDRRKAFITDTSHNLLLIYEQIESLSINPEEQKPGYIWLKGFLEDISEFDQMSDSFRYPYQFKWENDGFGRTTEMIAVFKERKNIDLSKLANKFMYAFILLQRLIRKVPEKCNSIEYVPGNNELNDFLSNPHLKIDFLEEGGSYNLTCVVGRDYIRLGFDRLARAYADCASYLYEKYKEGVKTGGNISCYHPMCYLLRNAIELSLKMLCTRCLSEQNAIELIADKKHNLASLWNAVKPTHFEGRSSSLNSVLNQQQIDFYLNIVAQVDGSSSRFRYPADKELKPYTPIPYRYQIGVHYYLLDTCFQRISATEDYFDLLQENYE